MYRVWLSNRGRWLLAVAVVAFATGGAYVWLLPTGRGARAGEAPSEPKAQRPKSDSPSPVADIPTVRVVRPLVEPFHRTTTQPAHIEAYEATDLFAKASGYVQTLHADIGDRVTKGQVVAELWVPEMLEDVRRNDALVEEATAQTALARASLAAAEAMTAAAEARLGEASAQIAQYEAEVAFRQAEHTRMAALAEAKAIQFSLVDEKLNHFRSAQASLASARAGVVTAEAELRVERARFQQAEVEVGLADTRLKLAQANLNRVRVLADYASVRAPFDGVVTHRFVDTGAFVRSAADGGSGPLFSVVRVDRLRVVADIPESESALAHVGQPAVLTVDALKGEEFRGRVARLSGALDGATRTMRIEVELDAPTTHLRPGMYGSVAILLEDAPSAMFVPAHALVYEDGATYVWCVVDGGAHRRQIDVGHNDGIMAYVRDGLALTDQVIVESQERLSEAQRVRAVE